MPLTHKAKVHIAKRLKAVTNDPRPMFKTTAWETRKEAIRKRVERREANSRLYIPKELK